VRFLGATADVRPYLEMCDVFVLPSLYEGMGIVLVEAMAMERACVATRASAVPEVVAEEQSGLLVPPANAAELSKAIGRLLADAGLRSRMGAEGRRIALERFDVSRNIRELESVYQHVAFNEAAA
jgi:glycosyltransferase involved in cell wall biosynthesis